MFCKDCFYFKQWHSLHIAMCEKLKKAIDGNERPCDEFILRKHLVNEWGEKQDGTGCCE